MKSLVVILHNIRSVYNVGAILRTCDGLGVGKVVASGYTPHLMKGLPHERERLRAQIHKTALGAEDSVEFEFVEDVLEYVAGLKAQGYEILALEQTEGSVDLRDFETERGGRYALILGEEVHGVPAELLGLADTVLEIGMVGKKESFNVSVAAGIALWELTR